MAWPQTILLSAAWMPALLAALCAAGCSVKGIEWVDADDPRLQRAFNPAEPPKDAPAWARYQSDVYKDQGVLFFLAAGNAGRERSPDPLAQAGLDAQQILVATVRRRARAVMSGIMQLTRRFAPGTDERALLCMFQDAGEEAVAAVMPQAERRAVWVNKKGSAHAVLLVLPVRPLYDALDVAIEKVTRERSDALFGARTDEWIQKVLRPSVESWRRSEDPQLPAD